MTMRIIRKNCNSGLPLTNLVEMFNGERILVAPLNWGLGHATRSIPVINALLEQGAEPVLGIDGIAGELLKERYPQLTHLVIPGVEVQYSKGSKQIVAMAKQLPALIASLEREKRLVPELVKKHELKAIISDQRYGVHDKAVPSVIMTHQVHPFVPLGQRIFRKQNKSWLKAFDEIWILDDQNERLAGELSDPPAGLNHRYLGTLSRFDVHIEKLDRSYVVVCVISGPEPQRTLLQRAMISKLKDIPGEHLLVIGRPELEFVQFENIAIHGHMDDKVLAPYLIGAQLVVMRSGYSSLMDLKAIGKHALIIPTPGQPEQEYLAGLHGTSERFLTQTQDRIQLSDALIWSISNKGFSSTRGSNDLVRALQELKMLIRK